MLAVGQGTYQNGIIRVELTQHSHQVGPYHANLESGTSWHAKKPANSREGMP